MKILLFLFALALTQNVTLFEKITTECMNHPVLIKSGGTCMIVDDNPNDVKSNYLYYFCNVGKGSWTHFEFYLIHSQNPFIYSDFSNPTFCKEGYDASDGNYKLLLSNISHYLSC